MGVFVSKTIKTLLNDTRTTRTRTTTRMASSMPTTYTGPVPLYCKTGRRIRFADWNAPDLGQSDEEKGLTTVRYYNVEDAPSSVSGSDTEEKTPDQSTAFNRSASAWVPPSVRRRLEQEESAQEEKVAVQENEETEETLSDEENYSSDEEWNEEDSGEEEDDETLSDLEEDDLEGIDEANIVSGQRQVTSPERLDQMTFLPGANNGHCAGRPVDTGESIELIR